MTFNVQFHRLKPYYNCRKDNYISGISENNTQYGAILIISRDDWNMLAFRATHLLWIFPVLI